ncbi:MAG: beta galactosidase jelly roll domain-containing protein, partial [Candidatus Marinimicrobia bacterium]|nr:beta galactosidase jelly roll domain-containing protein [Candidatus Neomarinimicrobiota bacterium]
MLYPVSNEHRTAIDLSGIWELKIDRDDIGIKENYPNGFTADHFIGVPGSWNEQLAEQGLMNYSGVVWYKTHFHTFAHHNNDEKIFKLRFDSAEHAATIWVNGKKVGYHQGGFIPFEFDITGALAGSGANRLVLRLDNNLDNGTIPQGVTVENFDEFNRGHEQTYPLVRFDFFNYGGLNRPVRLL